MRRTVELRRAMQAPNLVWNAFVDLIATENYDDLTPLQRKAHLVFWYDAEVQNGGHGQYFENRGASQLGETVEALNDLGLSRHAAILSRAAGALTTAADDSSWENLISDAELDDFDRAFHESTPTVIEGLERHLAAHTVEYVVLQ